MTGRLLAVEAILTVAALAFAFVAPVYDSAACRKIWYLIGSLAQRRALSAIAVGILALTLRLVMLPILPVPEPQTHDEFSYLLAADTFASGRVTNPAHPMWTHFESFHVNQQPTYASMYPPAQGLVLAAGKVFAGHPWVGVCFSASLMCTALCWMLQGWLPPKWALLGGLFAVVRIATFSYWGNSYWGGAVAAAGGALVLGAIPRVLSHLGLRDVLALGFGVIILANSRPYEGLLLCIAVAFALFAMTLKRRRYSWRILVTRLMLPLFLLLMTAAVMMGYYFWRVTGSPLLMPYQVNQQTYQMARALVWQSPRLITQYRHKEMRDYYEAWLQKHARARSSLQGFQDSVATTTTITWLFYLGPVLSLSLIGFPRAARDRRIRFLVIAGGVAVVGLLAESWFFPHYVAPFTGLIYALLLQSMRHLQFCRWRGRPTGRLLVLTIPFLSVVMFILAVIMLPAVPVQRTSIGAWCCAETGPGERSRIVANLKAQGGRHLVIVHYVEGHNVNDEWVYNDADIDNVQVVFARDMGPSENASLIEYFKDRTVWLLKPDHNPPTLSSY